jgi:hypothetical protein
MSEEIIMRSAKDKKELMQAAIMSTDEDLFSDGCGRVIVTGVLPCGDRIYLGEASEIALLQSGHMRENIIDRIRFSGWRCHE